MEAGDELDEESLPAMDEASLDNNNLQSTETMKITAMPTSSKTVERKEQCSMQRSSPLADGDEVTAAAESDGPRQESKVPLNPSGIKTERPGDEPVEDEDEDDDAPDIAARITRVKRLSCQETSRGDEDMTMEKIGRYLEANPALAESWIRENASPELKLRLQTCCLAPKKSSSTSLHHDENALNRSKRNSITSDLFQSWLASNSPIKRSRSPSR